MQYELIRTEMEQDGCRALKIKDKVSKEIYVYYTEEIFLIEEPVLKAFLFSRLKRINDGYYDVKSLGS
ncbi:hypothetical protein MUO14_08265 [Halobacillus shinanisalinarum]|uniref:KTSC domain-containing protein n=1 Tax=Halobacillus shinanisalinarum TaxID=2932258 RepID=A0ABY4H3N2_9BACI|nr:hypothetical protein [Halobacillus shinanisalinarum]UOQ94906.1 hypothetical protein MUO14_08265 [Halobacillus shinanisalinarum]